jgi:hypothetical protein
MMLREPLALALALTLAGCPRASTSATPITSDADATEPEPDLPPLLPEQPANREAGELLELTIPLLGTDPLELASLRGRPVVLEISASWEPGWTELHAFEADVVAQHPDLAVIVVAAEPDDRSLRDLQLTLMPAWDPAGALAAKLSVALFPTVFVLDRNGRILAVSSGWDDETIDVLAQAIDEALLE